MNDDPDDDLSQLTPFVRSGRITRWPQMVPDRFRRRWKASRHSFTFDWVLEAADDIPIEIALRNSAAVFEVLSGALEVGDGLESLWCRAGSAVAVSLDRFIVTPSSNGLGSTTARVHVMETVPLRGLILSNPVYSNALQRFAGTLPGIFDLTGPALHERKQRPDPGEAMVVRHSQNLTFLRFLASIPQALYRREKGKPIR
jgi:hypothetical protein